MGRGLTYEKRVGAELARHYPGVVLGQWLTFVDEGGSGYAQPDAYCVFPDRVVVFECKLTQCEAGELQLRQLYKPLLEGLFERPVVCVLVCKNLIYEPKRLILNPLGAKGEELLTWHYLGRRT